MIMQSLVYYGTRYGGTIGIAQEISDSLVAEGITVDMTNNKAPSSLEQYDLIIIGSGIKAGKWTDNALSFLQNNQDLIASKYSAFFVSCGEAMKPSRHEWVTKRYILRVLRKYPQINPVSTGVFGGVFDFEDKHRDLNNPYLDKIREEYEMKGIDTSVPIDFRDLPKVREWTRDICDKITY